ncbi:hypothetical protein EFN36_01125, partial [Leuconostoc mesenteroides]|nr:hypothetical protein [Leuconostoc mesenteroides]
SLSFHNIKKLLYLIISDYALEIKQSGFSVYEQNGIKSSIDDSSRMAIGHSFLTCCKNVDITSPIYVFLG